MYDPYSEFKKSTLSNGLDVYLAYWDRPWIGVEIIVHSGGREDPVDLPGLAHFVEHVVSENIPGKTHNEAKNLIESCGGRVNFGSTDFISTCYKFAVPADIEIFREVLNMFGSMLLQGKMDLNIERERKVILQEFNGKYPIRENLDWEMDIQKSLFKGHRLETWNSAIGRPEGFMAITKKELQDFYDRYYVPKNISLVVLGGLQTSQILSELENSSFGIRKEGSRNPIPEIFKPISVPKTVIVKFSDISKFKIDQTTYKASWAFPADFSLQALHVFSSILNAILFKEIREKEGLSYTPRTSFTTYQNVRAYKIHGNVNSAASSYIDELFRKCIEKIPLCFDLFEQKLKSIKLGYLMVDLSGRELINGSASDIASKHKIISLKEILDDLNTVTFEQMIEAKDLLSPERQCTFILNP